MPYGYDPFAGLALPVIRQRRGAPGYGGFANPNAESYYDQSVAPTYYGANANAYAKTPLGGRPAPPPMTYSAYGPKNGVGKPGPQRPPVVDPYNPYPGT